MTAESAQTFAELFGPAYFQTQADRLRQEGRQEGVELARAELLSQLIRTRFGDEADLAEIVAHLSASHPGTAALETIMAAGSMDDLRSGH